MWIVLLLLIFVWVNRRNSAGEATSSAASIRGGWHSPSKVLALGGQNIIGNQWDNNTTEPILRSQWTGYDDAGDGMVYAIEGGDSCR